MSSQQPTTSGPEGTDRTPPAGHREPGGQPEADWVEGDWVEGDWADEAAKARTADDPRRVTPHDPTGVPSTGDTR